MDIFPGAIDEGPGFEGRPIEPDGNGGFGGYEGGAYLERYRFVGPDGRDLGSLKIGADGRVEGGFSLTDGLKGEVSGFLGFRPSGPELNGQLGPVDVSGSAAAPLGVNANIEAGITAQEGLQVGVGVDAAQKVQAPEFKLDLGGGFAASVQPEGWLGPGAAVEFGVGKGPDGKLHITPKVAASPIVGGGLNFDFAVPLPFN